MAEDMHELNSWHMPLKQFQALQLSLNSPVKVSKVFKSRVEPSNIESRAKYSLQEFNYHSFYYHGQKQII